MLHAVAYMTGVGLTINIASMLWFCGLITLDLSVVSQTAISKEDLASFPGRLVDLC